MTTTTKRDLLGIEGMSRDEITTIVDGASALMPVVERTSPPRDDLAGRIVANMFFEDSTRTRGSFTVAVQRLGGQVLDFSGQGSSVAKGETLVDTALTVESFGVDAMVIRCREAGGPHLVAKHVQCPVINAGDGSHEHPTQALLDLVALRGHLDDVSGRTIAIVGDIGNSRVARSNIQCLSTMGAEVLLVGPPALVPGGMADLAPGPGRVRVTDDLDAVLPSLDAVMMLRVQFERGSSIGGDYRQRYALTIDRAARLPAGAAVLHPGPMNRGLEIDSEVADGPRSLTRRQVTAGVAVRMAVLASRRQP